MELNLTQLQQGWCISSLYIIGLVVNIYIIDIVFWCIKQYLKRCKSSN